MTRRLLPCVFALSIVLASGIAAHGAGDEAPAAPSPAMDEAFATYVDARSLQRALETLDAALLTDAALQVAEGERILFRPCRLLPADVLLGLAARAARLDRDEVTLARLGQAAKALRRPSLDAALSQAAPSAEASGGAAADVLAGLLRGFGNDAPGHENRVLLGLMHQLRRARLLGDAALVDRVAKGAETQAAGGALRGTYAAYVAEGVRAARQALSRETAMGSSISAALEVLRRARPTAAEEAEGHGDVSRDVSDWIRQSIIEDIRSNPPDTGGMNTGGVRG